VVMNAVVVLGSLSALVYFYFDEPGVPALMDVRASDTYPGQIENTAQQRLYFVSVIIGLLAAVVPLRVSSAWRRVARARSARPMAP
jgi:hypothetical protein